MKYTDKKDDIDPKSLLYLYESVGWNKEKYRTLEKNKKMLSLSSYVVGVINEGALIGFGRVLSDSYTGQILDLIVAPQFRRQGLAKNIMKMLVSYVQREKLIGTILIDGSGFGDFYEEFGFVAANTKTDRLMYLEL
jgi:ribosomal protein S18 acetylase RimI-like enzyme